MVTAGGASLPVPHGEDVRAPPEVGGDVLREDVARRADLDANRLRLIVGLDPDLSQRSPALANRGMRAAGPSFSSPVTTNPSRSDVWRRSSRRSGRSPRSRRSRPPSRASEQEQADADGGPDGGGDPQARGSGQARTVAPYFTIAPPPRNPMPTTICDATGVMSARTTVVGPSPAMDWNPKAEMIATRRRRGRRGCAF